MGIAIVGALVVIPEGDEDKIVQKDIFIEGDKIVGIGNKPNGFQVDKKIEGANRLVLPGLINCHTHSYMAIFRNLADDKSFEDWLFNTVMPLEEQLIGEDAYWGAKLAILEMMKSGTTCFSDMHMNNMQTCRAAKESGMRAVIARGLVGSGNEVSGLKRIAEAEAERDAYKDCDRLTFCLAPHAVYTCDEEFLKIIAKKAEEEKLGIHIHISESRTEVKNAEKQFGATPVEICLRAGLLDNKTVAAHCVYITEKDMDIIKEKEVSIVTNPASNMKLGNGFAPVPRMLEKGINVCLGTDGAASNNCLNMFREMSLLTLIHKGVQEEAQCISAKDAFKIATINGAKALDKEAEIGSICVGKKADIILLDLNTPSFTPRNNLLSALSYSANGSEVDTVIINGEITMENRKILTMDEEQIYIKIAEICKRLGIIK